METGIRHPSSSQLIFFYVSRRNMQLSTRHFWRIVDENGGLTLTNPVSNPYGNIVSGAVLQPSLLRWLPPFLAHTEYVSEERGRVWYWV